jgi:hypothetical protein
VPVAVQWEVLLAPPGSQAFDVGFAPIHRMPLSLSKIQNDA